MKYTYRFLIPSGSPPFKTRIRFTRGRYSHTTAPTGAFCFRYAVFVTKTREIWVPVHDLTDKTRQAIAQLDTKGA